MAHAQRLKFALYEEILITMYKFMPCNMDHEYEPAPARKQENNIVLRSRMSVSHVAPICRGSIP